MWVDERVALTAAKKVGRMAVEMAGMTAETRDLMGMQTAV